MNKESQPLPPRETPNSTHDLQWGKSNTLVLMGGILLLGLGYLAAWLVRQEMADWLGRVAPLFILTGYVAVFASVLVGPNQENQR